MTLPYTMLRLFVTFMKIGFVGFGGGLAILPLIYQSVMEFSNMDPETFANLFAISQATPGPMAINAATFVGFQVAGVAGAASATLGVAMPSFILVAITVRFINKYHENTLIKGAFLGIRPAATGMIAAAVLFIGKTVVFNVDVSQITGFVQGLQAIDVIPVIMALVTLILASKFKVSAIKLIIIMGAIGAFICR